MNNTIQWSGFFKELVGSCMRGEVDYTMFLGLTFGERGSDCWGKGNDINRSDSVTSLEEVLKCVRSDFTGSASQEDFHVVLDEIGRAGGVLIDDKLTRMIG